MPIDRNTAQYITGNPQQPTQSSAPGIWDIDEQGSAQAAGRWPLPPNVVQRSLRFNSADSAYLSRTPAAAGSRTTWTYSVWIKRGNLGASYELFTSGTNVVTGPVGQITLRSSNDLRFVSSDGSTTQADLISTQVFRDPSAWYHLVFAVDTTQGTSSNRIKIYVNGTQITAFSTATYPGPSATLTWNQAQLQGLFTNVTATNGSSYFDGYAAEINFVDGQALTPSSFGQTDAQTGQWIPQVYSGSYGTNGFRLQFLDNSGTTATTLGKDTSGMGNNWTPNNFSVAAGSGNDSLRDVPMNYYSPDNGLGGEVIGNYCTLNPLDNGGITLSNGNLDATRSTATTAATRCTFAVSSGKWYWEVTPTALGALTVGIGTQSASLSGIVGGDAFGYGWYNDSGGTSSKYNSNVSSSYGTALSAGVTCGVALDLDAGTITFYRNGVSQGVAYSGITAGAYFPMISQWGGTTSTANLNFGQRPFAYTAPSGFKALCTQNLSAPRIGNVAVAQANDYFNTVIWSGNGSTQSPTIDFAPDLVWVKNRSSNWSNLLYDTLRGPSTGSTSKALSSNGTDAEGVINDNSTYGYLSAFNSNGFTLTAGSYVGAGGYTNTSGQNYVGWCWNAGGSTVTNTSGTITSTVRANQTSGFSVVRFTGSATNNTVGHGLGAAPSFIIVKAASESGQSWRCYHQSLGLNSFITLNTTAGAESLAAYWGSSAFTTDIFGVYAGGGAGNNRTGQTMIAYCFAAVPGFSAFGSYTGNGSPDGPFVYTGFRPAFILGKRTDVSSIQGWFLFDAVRNTFNQVDLYLSPSSSNSQGAFAFGDMLSNGFKLRSTTVDWNSSGIPYIYAAFAEIPFQFANAR